MGYAFAKVTNPIALALDSVGTSTILWYIHFLACFVGLAYLPFSKFFHIFSTPVHLMVNAVGDHDRAEPVNVATRRAIELDACTHCGSCSIHCSVAPVFSKIPNANQQTVIVGKTSRHSGRKLCLHQLLPVHHGLSGGD
jgi:hypothetical protein